MGYNPNMVCISITDAHHESEIPYRFFFLFLWRTRDSWLCITVSYKLLRTITQYQIALVYNWSFIFPHILQFAQFCYKKWIYFYILAYETCSQHDENFKPFALDKQHQEWQQQQEQQQKLDSHSRISHAWPHSLSSQGTVDDMICNYAVKPRYNFLVSHPLTVFGKHGCWTS